MGMGKKYRFRKMYFLCQNKKVISPNVSFTNAYQFKEYAEQILNEKVVRDYHYMFEDSSIPLPKETVEGFYLVPEALFELILKDWVEKD